MKDSASVCKHDLSERSTLTVTIPVRSLPFGLAWLRCSACERQLVVARGVLAWFSRSGVADLWQRESSAFEAVASWSSSLTASSSSSRAPTSTARPGAAGGATSGNVVHLRKSRSSGPSAFAPPSKPLRLSSASQDLQDITVAAFKRRHGLTDAQYRLWERAPKGTPLSVFLETVRDLKLVPRVTTHGENDLVDDPLAGWLGIGPAKE